MTDALLHHLAFIDIETTGLDPSVDEVVELAVVRVERGVIHSTHTWRFAHAKQLPPMVQALTGLPERADPLAGTLADAAPDILGLVAGSTLVAHNADFERSFLRQLFGDSRPMLDSCELTQLLYPELRSHSLDALIRWAAVGPGARHRALDDAEDTFRVVKVALERAASEPDSPSLASLAAACAGPLGAMLAQLGEYRANHPRQATAVSELPRREGSHREKRVLPRGLRALETEEPKAFELLCREWVRAGVTVAVPASRWADVPDDLPRSTPASHRVCRDRLRQLLELPRFSAVARCYVRRWLERTPSLERAALSGWLSERWPDVRCLGLLAMAQPDCTCVRPAEAGGVVTHDELSQHLGVRPVVVLDAARCAPRAPQAAEGRRLRELQALYELAQKPWPEAGPAASDVRAVADACAPTGEAPFDEGLRFALDTFAQSLDLVAPGAPSLDEFASRLRAADALLVHDVVTPTGAWLSALGLGDGELLPDRIRRDVGSSVQAISVTVPAELLDPRQVELTVTGTVLSLGRFDETFVADQLRRAPGQVRLGLVEPAVTHLVPWRPGQSLVGLTDDHVTLLGPVRADDVRRLQLELPPHVRQITVIERVMAAPAMPLASGNGESESTAGAPTVASLRAR